MAIHEEGAYGDQPGLSRHLGLAHTKAATRETLMLPLFPDLTEDAQDYVLERLEVNMLARAA
jgi:dTDP-4-amino-4,6-dideoxygalactose transaminase